MRLHFLILASFMLLVSAPVFADEASIEGLWATEGEEAIVKIYACEEGGYCGRFYWLKDEDPMNPSRDDHNPDNDKKKRLLCGLKFLGGFEKQDTARDFGRGWIYSPRHGARFSAAIKLIDPDHLELRGYLFIPFLGDKQVWTRKMVAPVCHFYKEVL